MKKEETAKSYEEIHESEEEREKREFRQSIAENLKKYRSAFGYSQQEVANAIGTSMSALQKWEQGSVLPSVNWLVPLSKLYDISVEAFLQGAPGMDSTVEIKSRRGRRKTG